MLWFPEPTEADETWAGRKEQPFSWLNRSTLPQAIAQRAFLNWNLAALPVKDQRKCFETLKSRWQSAFFELIVARTLQALGGSISIEPESESGTRIDFVAQFPGASVNVEAIAPSMDLAAGEAFKERAPLLDIIDMLVPDGWGVGIIELPAIGANDSKKWFRETLGRLFHRSADAVEPFEIIEDMPQGRLHLRLSSNPPDGVRIMNEPAICVWNNTEARIRAAVKRKKRQARAVP